MKTLGHEQIFVEIHLERAAVIATSQRVGQRLLLDLREQFCLIDGDRDLIGNRAQQENFIFLPQTSAITGGNLQRTHQAAIKQKWHHGKRKAFRTRTKLIIAVADDYFGLFGKLAAILIQIRDEVFVLPLGRRHLLVEMKMG